MFLSLRWTYARLTSQVVQSRDGNRLSTIPFLLVLSTLLLIGLHGFSVIKMSVIFSLNYTIAKYCKGSRMGPLLTWLFNAAVLFANEYKEGYRFADIHSSLESWVCSFLAMSAIADINTEIGSHRGYLSKMACHFQHHDASTGLLQHGLLLGL